MPLVDVHRQNRWFATGSIAPNRTRIGVPNFRGTARVDGFAGRFPRLIWWWRARAGLIARRMHSMESCRVLRKSGIGCEEFQNG